MHRSTCPGNIPLFRHPISRIIFGSRITLYIVLLVILTAPVVGLIIGTIAGYFGGWTDEILMRITDIFLAFPKLILALALVAGNRFLGVLKKSLGVDQAIKKILEDGKRKDPRFGAQIGARVHLAGGVGIGGVLEPPEATPIMVGDDAFIGSRCMIVGGARVRKGAALGAGVILTASIPVIDAQTGEEISRGDVPEGLKSDATARCGCRVNTKAILGCVDNPHWLETHKRMIAAAIDNVACTSSAGMMLGRI